MRKVCGYENIQVQLECMDAQPGAGSAPSQEPKKAAKQTGKSYDKNKSPSEDEILKDALDIFGGMVIN